MVEIRKSIILPSRKKRELRMNWSEQQEADVFLRIFSLCRESNSLPRAGGLLDQDSLYVYLMQHAILCQIDRAELDRQREK